MFDRRGQSDLTVILDESLDSADSVVLEREKKQKEKKNIVYQGHAVLLDKAETSASSRFIVVYYNFQSTEKKTQPFFSILLKVSKNK